MSMHFFHRWRLSKGAKSQQALSAMRFAMGLGWGMVVGLALGFVLSWAVVQRFAAPQPVAWRAAVAKTVPSAQPVQTVAKAQTGR